MTDEINIFDQFKTHKMNHLKQQEAMEIKQQEEKIQDYTKLNFYQVLGELRNGIGYENVDEGQLAETATAELRKSFVSSNQYEDIIAKFELLKNRLTEEIKKEKVSSLCHKCHHADIYSLNKLDIPSFGGCLLINTDSDETFKVRQLCHQSTEKK